MSLASKVLESFNANTIIGIEVAVETKPGGIIEIYPFADNLVELKTQLTMLKVHFADKNIATHLYSDYIELSVGPSFKLRSLYEDAK